MVSLYRDPDGKDVFKSTAVGDNALSTVANTAGSHSMEHSMNLHVEETVTAADSSTIYNTYQTTSNTG